MQYKVHTIDVNNIRYSATYRVVDNFIEMTTGIYNIKWPIVEDTEVEAADSALRRLLHEHPDMVGIAIDPAIDRIG